MPTIIDHDDSLSSTVSAKLIEVPADMDVWLVMRSL